MKAILLVCPLVMACAADEPRSIPTIASQESFLERDDQELQGRYVLGNNVDDTLGTPDAHFYVSHAGVKGNEAPVVSVVKGRLTANHVDDQTPFTDAEFVGMVFSFGQRQLRITEVATDPETGLLGYVLEYFDGFNWKPYCDSAINKFAVPMKGSWTKEREHIDGNTLSFACLRSGVAAKCIEWDYSPGGPDDPTWEQHETCVQLAGADYCHIGIPRTRELTPIVIRDFVTDVKPHPADDPPLPLLDPTKTWPPPDDYYVEAAWQLDGPAICLSKLRWATLPPGGYCSMELPDPRGDDPPPKAVFCDALDLTQLANRKAIYQTASKVMDIRSHLWRRLDSGELVTSVDGYVEAGTVYSRPFRDKGAYYEFVSTSYILLRNLPGSVSSSDVTPLYKQHNPNTGDRVVAPIDPVMLPQHVVDMSSRPEGYMFNEWRPGLGTKQPLRLWRKGTDYVTALVQPPGFTAVANLGYVMAP